MSVDSAVIKQRFLDALPSIFTPAMPVMSGPAILKAVIAMLKTTDHQPSEEETAYMQNNGANLMTFAKAEGRLISMGKKQGYRLPGPSEVQPVSSVSSHMHEADEDDDSEPNTAATASVRQWEGFLHFAATLVLSKAIKGLVVSLPKAQGEQASFSNPDMVVVRDRYSHLEEELESHLDAIRQFGAEARYVLSSVELKYGIKNRKNFILAVSETTANSSWANESWLVFMQQPSVDRSGMDKFPDENMLEIARRSEVGVLEIIVATDGSYLDYMTHVYAKTRPVLTVTTSNELDTKYLQIAKDALESFRQKEKDATPRPVQRAVALLRQANKNLEKQAGFGSDEALSTSLVALRTANPLDYTKIAEALPETLMDAAGDLEWSGQETAIANALDECRMSAGERRQLHDRLRMIGFAVDQQKTPT